MEDLEDKVRLLPLQQEEKSVTSRLFEAYLACPTKCYLQSTGEVGATNDFANWNETRSETYLCEGVQRLTTYNNSELAPELPAPGHWNNVRWHFALNLIARAENMEASLQIVERIPPKGTNKTSQFVPIRFVPANKLSRSDKLMAGFDASVLSKASGVKVDLAKIVHGDKRSVFKVKTNSLSRIVHNTVGKIAALLSATAPPDLILNRHCPECGFQSRCRKMAVQKDDLSLLANLPDKERSRLNRKGIFTVNQLSYTFRPRRRIKRLADKPENYHHSLKALAIREQKIHIVGRPQLRIEGTPIYFDVEGIPDRNFYYLLSAYLETDDGPKRHTLWANDAVDEKHVWSAFLNILSGIDRPVLVHYGSFETMFLERMCDRYGGPPEDSAAGKAIASSINLLSVIFAQVYFPTYSNSLKEIAGFLGFEWTDPSASGLQSIVWRSRWEESGMHSDREKLIAYNAEDCEALSLVSQTLARLLEPDLYDDKISGSDIEIVHAETLGKNLCSKWRAFKSPITDLEHINRAAHWNYQRDRVFVRSGLDKKTPTRRLRTHWPVKKPETVVVLKAPSSCPECGKRGRRKSRLFSRTVRDLIFGRQSVKGRVVNYRLQTYRCQSCGHEYNVHEWYRVGARKWGWNTVAYFVYHMVGLRVPQLTVQHSLNRLFGFDLVRSTLNNLKARASDYYSVTKRKILNRIIHGNLIHADETRANIKGQLAYVWVLTNLREVVYILAESREKEIVQELLKDFKGVLVSDFYAAYDVIACTQQKCLIHLMRDLNDEILNNPFDEEMKSIAVEFASLLKPMVATIDRRGLKRHFLRKHLVEVDRFYGFLDVSDFKSEAASKCKQRFEKNRDKLFTFLHYDGVSWNNNNAEHAIKAFARLRDVISGTSTKKGVDEYLTLLTVAETCEYQGLDFLDFLRSGEKDVETFARGLRRRSGRQSRGSRTVAHAGDFLFPLKIFASR
jgi:predicted RecB family nuclease